MFRCSFVCISLSLFSSLSIADTCEPIRLDAPGGSMEHVQVHDLRQIGASYAHSAAQFFDAWRFTHHDHDYTRQSSGFEINQRYKSENGKIDIENGSLEDMISFINSEGTCADSDINKIFKPIVRHGVTKKGVKYSYTLPVDSDIYASKVMQIYNKYANQFYKVVTASEQRAYADIEKRPYYQDHFRIDHTIGLEVEKAFFRKKFLEPAIEELKAYNHQTLVEPFDNRRFSKIVPNQDTVAIFEALGLIKCDKRDRMYVRGSLRLNNQDHHLFDLDDWRYELMTNTIKKVIHDELNRGLEGAYPIGISHCSKVFKAGKSFSSKSFSNDDFVDEKKCARHSSLIIGRRPNPKSGRCEILVRNTWGKWCGSNYHSDWECEKEAGSVWVDQETLVQSIHSTQVLDRTY